MHRYQYFMSLAILLVFPAACARVMPQTAATPILSAPPVEGQHAAPPVAATPAVPENHNMQVACVLVDPGDETGMDCLGPDSQVITTFQTPGVDVRSPQSIHLAGLLPANGGLTPIVYHAWQPEVSLQVATGGGNRSLRETGGFLTLAGAAGKSALVYSEAALTPAGVFSAMIAGSLQDLGTASAFLERMDAATRMALLPLGVAAAGDIPTGVWYTQVAWDIGSSELVFPVTSGLSFFDLTAGRDRKVLENDRSPQGLSPDFHLAASVSFNPQRDRALMVHDLDDDAAIRFALDPASDRGAGLAVFSGDHSKVAWMEAQGVLVAEPPTFLSRVRIGDTATGSVLHQIEQVSIQQANPGFAVALARPVTWLDNQTLLIEVANAEWDQAALLRLDAASGGLSFFASGKFVGLAYQ